MEAIGKTMEMVRSNICRSNYRKIQTTNPVFDISERLCESDVEDRVRTRRLGIHVCGCHRSAFVAFADQRFDLLKINYHCRIRKKNAIFYTFTFEKELLSQKQRRNHLIRVNSQGTESIDDWSENFVLADFQSFIRPEIFSSSI